MNDCAPVPDLIERLRATRKWTFKFSPFYQLLLKLSYCFSAISKILQISILSFQLKKISFLDSQHYDQFSGSIIYLQIGGG